MKQIGLAALIQPASLAVFLSHFQSSTPLHVPGSKAGLGSVTALPCLASLDSLLRAWPDRVFAHLPKLAEEASSLEVSPSDAKKLFDNGMSLRFDEAQTLDPHLEEWLTEIRKDLTLSALTQSRCLLYATPKGKGTAPHFDQNVNFVLQLYGTKKWWLTPNLHVDNPLSRHTMGLPADPELDTYLQSPLPTEMPKSVEPVTLGPGSLLFVPRGTWHWTLAEEDAFSLNFTYSAPTYLDLFGAALRSRLALAPEWRETVAGVSGAAGLNEATLGKFDRLLAELTHDLPNWQAADILEATEG